MSKKEDIIKILNQEITFEELFNKKINYSFKEISFLKNKTILITGGGGSIGTSLTRQLLEHTINQVIILDHSEYAIFKLKLKFKKEIENKKIHLILGDVRNVTLLQKIISSFPIQIIYHTAAYKHIDILENNIDESISVNIHATLNLLKIASSQNVEQFIFVSTDKAVNPINKMGISKRITELHLIKQILQQKKDIIIKIIRFGNVFNSSGSVFTIFKYQIENKLPITITNKRMKRYFISKYQAARGLLEIANPSNTTGIYLLNMGKSLKIDELLHTLLKKLNLNFTPEISYIQTTTIVPEKIEEDLFFSYEKIENRNYIYYNINLENYNNKNVNAEIKKLTQLLKK